MKQVFSQENIARIEQILLNGNTAEIKKRRDDIVVLEVARKIRITEKTKSHLPTNG